KSLDRAEVAGPFENNGVARIDQAFGEQIETLLRSGDNQDVFHARADARRQGSPQPWLPFRGPMAENGVRFAIENLIVDAPVFGGGEAFESPTTQRERDDIRVAGVPHQVAKRWIGRA